MIEVKVTKAEGNKCERCWKYSLQVGQVFRWPELCVRCVIIIEENYPDIVKQREEELLNNKIYQNHIRNFDKSYK